MWNQFTVKLIGFVIIYLVHFFRIGFHWPPICSVYHLHLHIISPQQNISFRAKLFGKYHEKVWWFKTVSDNCDICSFNKFCLLNVCVCFLKKKYFLIFKSFHEIIIFFTLWKQVYFMVRNSVCWNNVGFLFNSMYTEQRSRDDNKMEISI